MPAIDLSAIESDINLGEQIAASLGPFLLLIPGIGPYVGAITAALPQIIKATAAVEQVVGHPIGSEANAAAVAAGINPESPATIPSVTGGK